MSLDSYLSELSDEGKPVVSKTLANLSSLSPKELLSFLDKFSHMSTARRIEIVQKLVGLAEDSVEMNFNDIFIACLPDPAAEVRVGSIEGLWEYEDRSIIDTFITMLNQDSQDAVRAAAATALGRFALLAELGDLRHEDGARIERALVSVVGRNSESTEVKRRALESVSAFSKPEIKQMIQDAYNSMEHDMRVSAIYAMGMNCDSQWLDTLLKELGNSDVEMRYEAAVACGELGVEDAVPSLIELIQDTDSQVQLSAIAALGRIGGDEAEAVLKECLNDPDEHVRDAAEDALDELSLDRDPFTFRI